MIYTCRHFKPHEYLPSGFTNVDVMDWRILEIADIIRELIGLPITINADGRNWCGYRPPSCDVGAKRSYHKKGQALDLHCAGMTANNMRQLILKACDGGAMPNLGRMEHGVSWVHIDLGARKNGKVHLFVP